MAIAETVFFGANRIQVTQKRHAEEILYNIQLRMKNPTKKSWSERENKSRSVGYLFCLCVELMTL